MNKKITVVKALANFHTGKYDVNDFKTQIKAGWHDWFCNDDLLGGKTGKLYNKLEKIVDSKKFDKTKTYVFFKQICTRSNGLFDSFSICDMKDGTVIYNITLGKGSYPAELYGIDNDFNDPIVSGTWSDIKKFFNADTTKEN